MNLFIYIRADLDEIMKSCKDLTIDRKQDCWLRIFILGKSRERKDQPIPIKAMESMLPIGVKPYWKNSKKDFIVPPGGLFVKACACVFFTYGWPGRKYMYRFFCSNVIIF
jgi:hypothetical protein